MLPAGAVLTVAVLSRVLLVVADVLLAAGFYVAGAEGRRRWVSGPGVTAWPTGRPIRGQRLDR